MNSSRFPGKMMADLCGKPVIQHVIDRTKMLGYETWLLTPESDELVFRPIVETNEINWYGGDEYDVASRFVHVCHERFPDWIIRVCGDQPMLNVDFTRAEIVTLMDCLARKPLDYYVGY